MAEASEREAVWHNDGHSVSLKWNRTELQVTPNSCPFEPGDERDCAHEDTRCLFEYFVALYGIEINWGVVAPSPTVDVAWTVMGNQKFLDESQLYYIPTEDEAFVSFLEDKLTPPSV